MMETISLLKGWQVAQEVKKSISCNYVEADTRILLHSSHASQLAYDVVIYSPETDILILSIAYASEISSQFIICLGTGEKQVFFDIHELL